MQVGRKPQAQATRNNDCEGSEIECLEGPGERAFITMLILTLTTSSSREGILLVNVENLLTAAYHVQA